MGRTVVINEDQYRKLFNLNEARKEGFRLDMLKGKPFIAKDLYLSEYLGKPIGRGSSRWVYQIDDWTVLKLAVNDKGYAQNEAEYTMMRDNFIPILPKLYNGTDEVDYEWIITDYVLPAKSADFKKEFGIPFKVVQEYCDAARGIIDNRFRDNRRYFYDKYENNDNLIEFFSAIDDYVGSYDANPGDLKRICNWGLSKDGVVILDAGFTEDVRKRYYS
jgi:hypothetical protein